MSIESILGIIGNSIQFALLLFTIYSLNKNIKQQDAQIKLIRNDNKNNQNNGFTETWSKVDSILIEHPELSEIWLEPETIKIIKEKYTNDELLKYYKKRAFASIIFDVYFRRYNLRNEINYSLGGDDISKIELNNQELYDLWNFAEIKNDFETFPEFIDFIEKKLFRNNKYLK